ncbi:acetyl-CoA carboxylase, biotin carboxyl carrier protein [Granulicella tundricola MP5ACTX9]|uniref:Biotin carboxyl carrier protein of acetyl-CoA carboxylase n=2 Tax=Granulicella TaxID=940557 RepID=E8X039_GRATM|nr:acetyl-CoA carboxylase biotin carboxyl carrier protein [Granulicella tundricola]ADW68935.1 acetyl-CoA carboxylase, biotin carboxyl carrier protein [Granulicella tundricola MP5ACTX9]
MQGNELKDFLKELIEFLKSQEVAEFDLEQADLKVRLKFAGEPVPAAPAFDMAQLARMMSANQAPVMAAPAHVAPSHAVGEAPAAAAAAPVIEDAKHHVVKSPIVGTFYDAPSPGSPSFVKVGDVVEVGQVLCIVEAMKLMNEIESDMAGEIVERIAKAGQPVEYGQPLFAIKAK